MKQKKRKTTREILDDIDERNEYLNKLDKIREERKKLNSSSFNKKMKDNKKSIGEIKQND